MAKFAKRIICTYLYIISKYGYPPPARDTLMHLEEMKNLGFQSVELEGIREEHLSEIYNLRAKIQTQLQKLHLEVPFFCIVLPGLSSLDPAIRQRNLDLFRLGCETAADIGASGVLDNAPLPPYRFPANIPVVRHYDQDVLMQATIPADIDWDDYWSALCATYREACDIAGDFSLTYAMHPCLGVLAASADAFRQFSTSVDRPNLRFNLDTANQYMMKENINLALLRLKKFVDYIHISDNRGQKVEHLQPGKGTIPWGSFFQMLNQVGFNGHLGLDIGGEESHIPDLDKAYTESAIWLQDWLNNPL